MGAIGDYFKNSIRNFIGLDEFSQFGLNVLKFRDASPVFNDYSSDINKLNVVLSNPACLKVFALQCDLFSMGKVYVKNGDKYLDTDPFIDMLNNPNPFQSYTQLAWDFMFWNMLGNSYCYIESGIVGSDNKIYFLENQKMEFPNEMMKYKDKLVLSDKSYNDIVDFDVKYIYSDGNYQMLKWKNIIHIPDLTNGTGNWFKGNSRIDALYKVISNSEASLDSKNINVRYAGKYMVSGQSDTENLNTLPLSEKEKTDIETKMNSKKTVHAVKSMIDIKRFVENIANLKLDDSYTADYFTIGSMYGIPKDVLEANLKGATYENQEKSIGKHISYTLQPKAEALMNSLIKYFKYPKKVVIDWEHLPFMQVFAKERAEVEQIKANTLLILQQAGVSLPEINKFLDTEFTGLNTIQNEVTQSQNTAQQRESNTNT